MIILYYLFIVCVSRLTINAKIILIYLSVIERDCLTKIHINQTAYSHWWNQYLDTTIKAFVDHVFILNLKTICQIHSYKKHMRVTCTTHIQFNDKCFLFLDKSHDKCLARKFIFAAMFSNLMVSQTNSQHNNNMFCDLFIPNLVMMDIFI